MAWQRASCTLPTNTLLLVSKFAVDAETGHQDAAPVPETAKTKPPKEIPESLRQLQDRLIEQERATDEARKARNIEVARLRDELKISQYRISKWLGVTERAVMLMAKQGREYGEQKD